VEGLVGEVESDALDARVDLQGGVQGLGFRRQSERARKRLRTRKRRQTDKQRERERERERESIHTLKLG
jgi:sRNA-binding protein